MRRGGLEPVSLACTGTAARTAPCCLLPPNKLLPRLFCDHCPSTPTTCLPAAWSTSSGGPWSMWKRRQRPEQAMQLGQVAQQLQAAAGCGSTQCCAAAHARVARLRQQTALALQYQVKVHVERPIQPQTSRTPQYTCQRLTLWLSRCKVWMQRVIGAAGMQLSFGHGRLQCDLRLLSSGRA